MTTNLADVLAKLAPENLNDIAVQSGNPYLLSSVSRGLRQDLREMKPPQAVVIEAHRSVYEIRTMLGKLNEQYTIFSVHLKADDLWGVNETFSERFQALVEMSTPHMTHLKLSGNEVRDHVVQPLVELLHRGHLVSLELDRIGVIRNLDMDKFGDAISNCPSLKRLSITNSLIYHVERLGLHRCKTLTHLTLHNDRLRTLDRFNNRFTDELIHLLSLPNLVELDLSSNHLERMFYDPRCWGPGSLSRIMEAVEKSGLRRLDLRQNESSITTPLSFETFGKLVNKGVEVLLDEA